jgi:hypothetical protein
MTLTNNQQSLQVNKFGWIQVSSVSTAYEENIPHLIRIRVSACSSMTSLMAVLYYLYVVDNTIFKDS